MSLTVKELSTSRNFTTAATGATLSVDVIVFDATPGGTFPTELEVYRAARDYAPSVYLGMRKLEVDGTPLGGGVWQAHVKYGVPEGQDNPGDTAASPPPPPPQPAEEDPLVEVSVTVAGVQQHVSRALHTVSRTGVDGATAPNYHRALNVTQEGTQGLDIESAVMEITITRIFPLGVSLKYLKKVRDMFDCVNSATFFTFPAGELRFKGATFAPHKSNENAGGVVGTFTMVASKNRTDIVIVGAAEGDAIGLTVPAKKGWEYLWVAYQEAVEGGRKVQIPIAAYVEQIYDVQPFSNLGIG